VIGEQELEVQRRHVSQRVDRAFGVRHGWIRERANEVHERVGVAELAELLRADAFTGSGAFRQAEIAVRDLGERRLLRLEQRG